MSGSYGPRIEPRRSLHREQIATLNQALTAEVLRHAATQVRHAATQVKLAETQRKLQRTLDWCHWLESEDA